MEPATDLVNPNSYQAEQNPALANEDDNYLDKAFGQTPTQF
jgi:hypothetical protein